MMKNRIFGLLGIAFIAALITINLKITSLENNSIDLSSLSLIPTANAEQGDDAEYGGWGNFWQGQGLYKDEWPIRESCPTYEYNDGYWGIYGGYGGYSGGIYGGGSEEQINPPGRTDIRCTNGNSNCTPIDC